MCLVVAILGSTARRNSESGQLRVQPNGYFAAAARAFSKMPSS